jgi:hypothetical protein
MCIYQVAKREDSEKMALTLNALVENFAVLDATVSSSAKTMNEVQDLLMKALTLCEEARTRQIQRSNDGYKQASHNRPLDPATQAQKTDISARMRYIENQTNQAMASVDQTLTVRPFRFSSNMALNKSLLLQRKCAATLSSSLDSMDSKVIYLLSST